MSYIKINDPLHAGGSTAIVLGTVLDDNTGDRLRAGGVKLVQSLTDQDSMNAEIYASWAIVLNSIAFTYAAGVNDNVTPTGFIVNKTNRIEVTADPTGSTVDSLPACNNGWRVRLPNVGTTGTLKLAHEAVGSTAAGRLHLPGLNDVFVPPGNAVTLEYVASISRWMII